MDFTLEETQQAVVRLAAEVLDQGRPTAGPSPVPAARDADGYDSALWKELGQAGRSQRAVIWLQRWSCQRPGACWPLPVSGQASPDFRAGRNA